MRRFLPHLLAIGIAALTLGGAALAEESPEFKLGFEALAAQIPDVVGVPLENEHYDPNGDSLQRTTTGLMVWRKADNLAAFTNGHRTWVSGPFGLQQRGNDERFDWESQTAASGATPTAPATPTASPSPPTVATSTPSPTPAPEPSLSSSLPHLIQGQGLEANSVWVLGELRNDGPISAYNVTVTARLMTSSGAVAGTANQAFAFLGAGDTVGYRVEVRDAAAYERAEVSIDSASAGFGSFTKLPVTWVSNQKITDGQGTVRYEFTGAITNDNDRPVSLNAVYVWFLDDQNRLVWMDYTYIPNALAPGDSQTFTVRTARDGANPQVSGITQVRYYAAGRLQ